MCGLPEVSPPENLTLEVGQTASFLCVVDMTCMVSYVEWYRHNDNGQYSVLTILTQSLGLQAYLHPTKSYNRVVM